MQIQILPRKIISRRIFWPVFIVFLLFLLITSFWYNDAIIARSSMVELVPETAEFYAVVPLSFAGKHAGLAETLNHLPLDFRFDGQTFARIFLGPAAQTMKTFNDNLADDLEIAKFNNYLVFSLDLARDFSGSLQFEKSDYRGYEVFRTGQNQAEIYYLRFGKKLIASTEQQAIKDLIDRREALRPLSFLRGANSDGLVASLSENSEFEKLFASLDDASLKIYSKNSLPREFQDFLKDNLPVFLVQAEGLFQTQKQDIPLALALNGSGALSLRLTQSNQTSTGASLSLASLLPALPGYVPDFYLETDKLSSLIVGAAEKADGLDHPQLKYLLNIRARVLSEVDADFLDSNFGRAALMSVINDEGQLSFIIAAKYNNEHSARGFANLLAASLAGASSDPYYFLAGDYLLFGSHKSNLLEVKNKFGDAEATLDQHLKLENISPTLFVFLKSEGLVRALRNIADESGATIQPGITVLAEILPTLTVSSYLKDGLSIFDWKLGVNEVSLVKKEEARKLLLNIGNSFGAAGRSVAGVRDTNRRADILILQNAIIEFSSGSSRAPAALSELVPAFLNNIPLDPVTGREYRYSNLKFDKTFFMEFNLESDSTYGAPGVYCLTAKGVALRGNVCFEE